MTLKLLIHYNFILRATFTTPTNPANADLAKLQNQLNDYLAVEAGVRVRFLFFPPDSSNLPLPFRCCINSFPFL